MSAALREEQTPGASVAVLRGGRIVFAAGFGTRDAARHVAADAGTRYGIGSLTKTLVAALVLRLCESGRLSLNDSVTRWLPSYVRARHVTIAELLRQTSGIRDYNDGLFLATVAPDVVPGHVDRGGVIDALERWPLEFEPGTRFAYSNANYLLLGAIAEHATGTPLAELLRRDIFDRVGMPRTALGPPLEGDEAAGFTKSPFGPVAVPPWDAALTYAAGGVRSTAIDLARFDAALCEGRIVGPASLQLMTVPSRLENGARSDYAAGFYAYTSSGTNVVWHDGTVLGYKAMHLLIPSRCDAVVVLANADYFHAAAVAMRIADVALGVPGGSGEPFDPNLPRWSMLIAAGLACLPIAAFTLRRRHAALAAAAAAGTYCVGAVWLPAGIAVGVAAAVAVAFLPSSGSSRAAQRTSAP